jgi:methionine aminopeptidase
MISIKNEQEIKYMREAGIIAYDLLMELKNVIKPGITTKEIDDYCYKFIKSRNAIPAFLGYDGFPATACISLNDMVVHGIPDNTKIKDFPIHANIDMVGIKEEVEKYTNVTHRKQVVYFESNGIIPQEKIDEMNESLKRSDYL